MLGIRGLVGQSMSGWKLPEVLSYVRNLPAGTYQWTAPRTGRFRFVLWGGGGTANATAGGGGGGAHAQILKWVNVNQVVTIVVGAQDADTTATFPDGLVVTAGKGATGLLGGAGGTATNGDINVSGSAQSSGNGGAAGGSGNYAGGAGATGLATPPGFGGGGYDGGSATPGAPGLAIIVLEAHT